MRRVTSTFAAVLLTSLVAGGVHADGGAISQAPSSGGRRLALVVGNAAYSGSPLQNPVSDARAISKVLRNLGFAVTTIENATRAAIVSAVGGFEAQIRSDDVALFYFSGHGMAMGAENYLIPIDYRAVTESEARMNAMAASDIQAVFGRARISLLILDACRSNPFTAQRTARSGLAPMEGRGSLVAFATGAGQTASDNPAGANGLFTEELLIALGERGVTLREMLFRVRQRVYDKSGGSQFPAVYDGLLGDVVLTATTTASSEPPVVNSPPNQELVRQEELVFWGSIKDGTSVSLFEDYLRQFPEGRFKVIAQERIVQLRATTAISSRIDGLQGTWRSGDGRHVLQLTRRGNGLSGTFQMESGGWNYEGRRVTGSHKMSIRVSVSVDGSNPAITVIDGTAEVRGKDETHASTFDIIEFKHEGAAIKMTVEHHVNGPASDDRATWTFGGTLRKQRN
jgi:uncharacterized caspase-like protein